MAGGEQRSNQPVLFSFFAPIVGAFFVPYQGCPSHALMLSTREKNIIGGDYWFRVSFGAADQIRTGDLILTKDALYLLSYISNWLREEDSNL